MLKISTLIFLSEHYLGYGVLGYVYLRMPDIVAYSIRNNYSPYKPKSLPFFPTIHNN